MDTAIKSKSKKFKFATLAAIGILAFATMAYLSFSKKKSLNVKTNEILVKTASEEYFEDFMVFQARVEPLNAMLVNIVEGGSVQEIFAENGSRVEKGQALAKLYNPNSELNYMTQETAIIEQMNNLNVGKLNIRNQELQLTQDLLSIEHDYNDAKRLHDLNKKLFEKDVISRNEWHAIDENLRFQRERRNNIQLAIQKEKQSNQVQIAQINRSIATMEKSLEILRSNKKNFLITAPASGVLTSFEPILGKSYPSGESIGKIDVMQGYKLVADVDEFYLEKVAVGQKGQIDYKGEMLEVTVIKVLPEVKGGRFQLELSFSKTDLVLQRGLSFGVKLTLSEKQKVLVVPKGQFYSETAGQWIFAVNGNQAVRKPIKIGRENPDYYEVLGGLKPGDRVVTSSYADYKDIEVLKITQ
ncbi:efflux RND transporter periplasmic adaptor subunit [Flavobacterium caeni]|uniref:HlyD family secretion protein n=1 Tax=Flavobacterium caeni TaxID=490189 RepID=A0A1G5G6V6_9FLAO|nr:efflux RND transporter periplasmic adaptor subunit [Flavobacterium caeni]SCY47081.1 HlyD family secretion protein [Flavobacterium caeni]